MDRIHGALRLACAATLALSSAAVWADGAGTIDDTNTSLAYTGAGPYFPANVTGDAGAPVCEPGTPLCDTYAITVNFSDTLRADPANAGATLDITVECGGTADDFDAYLLDSSGAIVAEAASAGCPEAISMPLDLLANGAYTLQVIPYTALPDAGTFDLSVAVTGLASATKSGSSAGAFGGLLLLVLGGLAGLRRR